MKLALLLPLCAALALPATAETVIAARTLRAQSVLTPADLRLSDAETPGAYTSVDEVVGLEARVALYAGRPILSGEVGPPALIDRNQIVTLLYQQSGLEIVAEGRALGRAGLGDRLRVMNLASRHTVTGRVRADGTVIVNP